MIELISVEKFEVVRRSLIKLNILIGEWEGKTALIAFKEVQIFLGVLWCFWITSISLTVSKAHK